MRKLLVLAIVGCTTTLGAASLLAPDPWPFQRRQGFRSAVTMVPVDVRVLDERGNPIDDLQAHDFTVLEEGVAQEVRQFSRIALTPRPPAPGERPAFRGEGSQSLSPQDHRVFLIVLGRGRLQGPSKGIDALIDFVRGRLLPQDQVAVLAYNRATDFTTRHADVAGVLERFRRDNDLIESKLVHWYSGPPALYGDDTMPRRVQPLIDALFAGPSATRFRELPAGRIVDEAALEDEMRREAQAELAVEPFASYVSNALETRQDLGSIYTGIEYMRFLEGEKHLIYVTTAGLFLPRLEHDLSLAAVANDARVVIDTVQTGGIFADPPALRSLSENAWRHHWAISAVRNVSEFTGGRAFVFRYGHDALDRIDRMTRSGYLLGYYPADAEWDGRYRRIEVKVKRRGARVFYRHGYYARPQLIPFDRQQFTTFSRILSAAAQPEDLRDIKIKAKASFTAATREVAVAGTIDLERVGLTLADGMRTGRLDVALFALDSKDRLVGEQWETVPLSFDEESYRRATRDGMNYTTQVKVRALPLTLKIVVYAYDGDILGTTVIDVGR